MLPRQTASVYLINWRTVELQALVNRNNCLLLPGRIKMREHESKFIL
jgi:hypothetical protein